MSIVTASLVLLTKQDTFKYNVLLELTKKLHEEKALKSVVSVEYLKKNQKQKC